MIHRPELHVLHVALASPYPTIDASPDMTTSRKTTLYQAVPAERRRGPGYKETDP